MRGAAAVTAANVASCPRTGIVSQACGDCHPANFGLFASLELRLLFDIIDFDETLPASWEFDVKRLAASFILMAREQGCGRDADGRPYDVRQLRALKQTISPEMLKG